jgi:hypothetical protein
VRDSKKGNAALSKPIGLLNMDEAAIAGGLYSSPDTVIYPNNYYYLYKGYSYWLMSPVTFEANDHAYPGTVNADGGYWCNYTTSKIGLVPVINLSYETANSLIGTGTMDDAFRLE